MARPTTPRQVPLEALLNEDSFVSSVALRWLMSSVAGSHTLSASEQIAARIGSRIVSGVFPPGARLLEQDLAKVLKVSRGPIREAHRILEREGLVRILARRGSRVTEQSAKELRDLFDIRAALFGRLIRDATRHHRTLLLEAIEEGMPELERAAGQSGSAERYALGSFKLTLTVAQVSPNIKLREMVVSFALQTLRYAKLGFPNIARRQQSLAMWRKLTNCVRRGNSEDARQIIEGIIEASVTAICANLEKFDRETHKSDTRQQIAA